MKGGITSGVVYPYTITELATEYCFKSIGGTSAGAIAATLTAASELGRREGNVRSFDVIAELPAELGKEDFLLHLFQPSRKSSKILKVLLSALRSGSTASRIFAVLVALIGNFWLAVLVGSVVGLIVPVSLWLLVGGPAATYVVLSALWVALFLAASIAFSASRTIVQSLGSGGFGMCSGATEPGFSKQLGLTDWLHQKIQSAAGRQPGATPVTFGDLWKAKVYPGEEANTERSINLQMVTTNLTEGRPYTLPMEFRGFYFDPKEFAGLFPAEVLQWMINNDGSTDSEIEHAQSARNVLSPDGTQLLRFPEGDRLPILVAARMSLSFPILLKAVPLYAIDFSLAKNRQRHERAAYVAERCWFSDGGICSNFPMHFFDSPLPRWPTFGINLKAPHPDHDKSESDFVWLPTQPGSGRQLAWNRFDSGSDWARILRFFGAIINTMQNWRDNIQATAAGYRDRIVHVSLRPNEGGLNLNMPPELISLLSERGRTAGTLLRTTFSFSDHMWARYRLTMCSIHDYLRRLDNSWRNPVPQNDLGREYINGQKSPPHFTGKNRGAVEELRRNLLQLASVFQNWIDDPCEGAPRPKAELRGQPKY
jgi:predicted acylesterase/phospholipase RssA